MSHPEHLLTRYSSPGFSSQFPQRIYSVRNNCWLYKLPLSPFTMTIAALLTEVALLCNSYCPLALSAKDKGNHRGEKQGRGGGEVGVEWEEG